MLPVGTITSPWFWLPSFEAVSETLNEARLPGNNWRIGLVGSLEFGQTQTIDLYRTNHVRPLFRMG